MLSSAKSCLLALSWQRRVLVGALDRELVCVKHVRAFVRDISNEIRVKGATGDAFVDFSEFAVSCQIVRAHRVGQALFILCFGREKAITQAPGMSYYNGISSTQ